MSENVGSKYSDPTENDVAYRRSVLRFANANDLELSFEEAAVLRERTIATILAALAELSEEVSEEAMLLVGILEEDLDWRALSPQNYEADDQTGLIPNVYEGLVLGNTLLHLANIELDRSVMSVPALIVPPPDLRLSILNSLGIQCPPTLSIVSDTISPK